MPVGFVPLHCFCISPPTPPTLSFSCDSELSDKKQSHVALGLVVLFTVPALVFSYATVDQKMTCITTHINLEQHSVRIMIDFMGVNYCKFSMILLAWNHCSSQNSYVL